MAQSPVHLCTNQDVVCLFPDHLLVLILPLHLLHVWIFMRPSSTWVICQTRRGLRFVYTHSQYFDLSFICPLSGQLCSSFPVDLHNFSTPPPSWDLFGLQLFLARILSWQWCRTLPVRRLLWLENTSEPGLFRLVTVMRFEDQMIL